jgi:quinol-cytochrome oxidoreductase complex cytochrome b subunit
VQTIAHLVPYGWLIRGLHNWAGQAVVLTAGLRLVRVVLTGAYKPPRRLNWLLGLSLLVLTVLLDFTGLVLRWDGSIAWALMVGTDLIHNIPFLWPSLYLLAVGSGEIGEATPMHFYAWHIFGLALPAFIVIVWHAFRVRRYGGISHRDPSIRSVAQPAPTRLPRAELLRREAAASLLAAAALIALTLLFPPGLAPKADFQNPPPDASAPWFFLWVQQLLRFGDPFWMGAAIPVGLLTLLALLPFLVDRSPGGVGEWFNRRGRLPQTLFPSALALVAALALRGVLSR